MTTIDRSASPPGWYPDPGGGADERYWDGDAWTDGVVVDGEVTEAALPPAPIDRDQRAQLPGIAAGWALLGVIVGVVGAGAAGLLARALTDARIVELAVSQAVLWAAVLTPVVVSSRRYGSGDLRRDYQLCWRGVDAAIGLGLSFAARIAAAIAAVIAIALTSADPRSFSNQLEVFADDHATLYLAFAFALFGAPIIEELFFRGLLQRSLQPSLGVAGAIGVQAVLFGAAHATVVATWQQNVVLVGMLTAVGATAGVVVHMTKRLAPAMWMHFFFNAARGRSRRHAAHVALATTRARASPGTPRLCW